MTVHTIGQRIAQERKRLGLSQEALGEKMGVSRQAISKWESDGAVPEIDKLIALSKLFGVSVDWLLGMEKVPEKEETDLTEERSKAPEELTGQTQSSQPQEWHTTVSILAAILILLISFLGVKYLHDSSIQAAESKKQVTAMEERLRDISARLAVLEAAVLNGDKPDISLTTDYSFAILLDPDLEKQEKVELRFRALPLQWEDGDSAYLAIRRNDQELCQVPCQWDGKHLNAQYPLDVLDGYEYALFLCHADGIQEQQMLFDEHAQNLHSGLRIQLRSTPGRINYKNGVLTLTGYHVFARQPEYFFGTQKWTALDFVLYRNGKEEIGRDTLLDAKINVNENIDAEREIIITGHLIQFRDLVLAPGDTLELRLYASLSTGESAEIAVQTFTGLSSATP